MNRFSKLTCVAAIVVSAMSHAWGAANAPTTLPTCIVQYSQYALGYGTIRVVLYDSSGSYSEISAVGTSPVMIPIGGTPGPSSSTSAPHHGTYTYAVDVQNPQHATITYDGGGAGSLPNDNLYFSTATAGSRQPPGPSIGSDAFTLFPIQATTGASNLSNRITLPAGGKTITGFAISGSKTTWVLIRAVGAGLGTFGVSPTVSQPSFTLYGAGGSFVATSAAWAADPNLVSGYKEIAARVGAFPLSDSSDEGVLLMPLAPGTYTAVFSAKSAGEILCETYILPFAADGL